MNNNGQSARKTGGTPVKKITTGLVLGWVLGILISVAGIVILFSEPLAGIFLLLAAAILLPPISKLLEEQFNFTLSGGLKFVLVVVFLILAGVFTKVPSADIVPVAEQETSQTSQAELQQEVTPQSQTEPQTQPQTGPQPQPEPEPELQPEPEPETIFPPREEALVVIKEDASDEWGSDYEMVRYEIDNQTKAYDWIVRQEQYPQIMENAYKEWGHDYEMIRYEYENQVEAYGWIQRQTRYPNIMKNAKQKWGDDYEMVKYEYENQVEAYESLL